jgi:hypothetical protein
VEDGAEGEDDADDGEDGEEGEEDLGGLADVAASRHGRRDDPGVLGWAALPSQVARVVGGCCACACP